MCESFAFVEGDPGNIAEFAPFPDSLHAKQNKNTLAMFIIERTALVIPGMRPYKHIINIWHI